MQVNTNPCSMMGLTTDRAESLFSSSSVGSLLLVRPSTFFILSRKLSLFLVGLGDGKKADGEFSDESTSGEGGGSSKVISWPEPANLLHNKGLIFNYRQD